jgi:hypothetical protein
MTNDRYKKLSPFFHLSKIFFMQFFLDCGNFKSWLENKGGFTDASEIDIKP